MLEKFIVVQHENRRDMFYIGDEMTVAKIAADLYDKYANSDMFVKISLRKASTGNVIGHVRVNFKSRDTGVAVAHSLPVQRSFVAGTKNFFEKYVREFEKTVGGGNAVITTKRQGNLYIAECEENVYEPSK